MQEKVWEPLGMEYDASVSLDDSRHRVAKSYGGITTCAIDLAKVGRLYLNMGNWNGQQIIDSAWVKKSICRDNLNYFYAYCWYNTSRHIVNSEGTSEFFGDWHEVAERFDELGVPKDGRMFYTLGWKEGDNAVGHGGKTDKTNAVIRAPLNEFAQFFLGNFQSIFDPAVCQALLQGSGITHVGGHIDGGHAAGQVKSQNHIDPLGTNDHLFVSETGTSQGHHQNSGSSKIAPVRQTDPPATDRGKRCG